MRNPTISLLALMAAYATTNARPAMTQSSIKSSIEPPMQLPSGASRPGTRRRRGITAAQIKRAAKKDRAVRREKRRRRSA